MPTAYYTRRPAPEAAGRGRASAVVKKGGQLQLDFPVTEKNCFLRLESDKLGAEL